MQSQKVVDATESARLALLGAIERRVAIAEASKTMTSLDASEVLKNLAEAFAWASNPNQPH
ncbi:hypothetical protein ACWCQM_11130 [Streptomyces sp. NPDC002125]